MGQSGEQILMSLAILPAVVLLFYIRKKDLIEKEPIGLILKLMGFGALSTISAIILETIGGGILGAVFSQNSMPYIVLENFFVVGLAEELGKLFVLKKCTWKNPEFNYTYDAVVYAVAASLGFAVLENILYVLDGGLSTALMRAVTAIPGHTVFGVIMGYYYGMAKKAEMQFDHGNEKKYLRHALFVPLIVHGFYDYCLSVGNVLMLIVFLVYDIGIVVFAIQLVKKLAREDSPLVTRFSQPDMQFGPGASAAPNEFRQPVQPNQFYGPQDQNRPPM